jgi:transcriptional regulator with XRE-family HTH domain
MDLGELVSRNIKMLRQALDLSQEELATRVGCSVRYVGLMEKGAHSPTVKMLGDLAHALNVQPFVLLLEAAPHMIAAPKPRRQRASAKPKAAKTAKPNPAKPNPAK